MGDGESQTMSTPASRSGVGSRQSNESRAGRSKSASIVEVVSRRIEAGEYAPGQRLPSNAQLCTEFGVSSMTVRRAVVALKERGLVSSTRGKGTFVRSLDIGNADFRLGSVDGDWLDGSTDMRLLSLTMAQADEKTAARLGVPLGERIVCLRRLVSYESGPSMLHTEYVVWDPRRPLLESQLQLTSLQLLLEADRGQPFPLGELTVRAVNIDSESAAALGAQEGAAVLCLEHLFRDSDGHPVSWGSFLLRAEVFQLRAKME